ncbi:MAG TPA: sulfatase-like hydrolase/transferase, partial [Phycisphaerales bacterium]|nr:sulfatase-like hydrolase/transferase [Phycisphaerales bacterium]
PYAPALPTTPFLAGLAARGALVERMYAEVPYTNKALVSLFAGIPPSPDPDIIEAEAVEGGLPARGLPALLGEHGYRTAFFTPATLAYERKDVILENLGFAEAYGDGDFPTEGFAPKAYFGHEDRVVLPQLLAWVREASAEGRPFFAGVLTLTGHHPYDTPAAFPRQRLASEPELDDYLNAIRYTDDFLRELVGGLAAAGVLEETVLVVVGDHGEAFGEHGARTHGDILWDEALHVPAVVVAPGLRPGTRIGGVRASADLVPTVADLLGFRLEGGRLAGSSLLRPPPARTIYHAGRNGRAALALRRGHVKYLYWGRRRPMQVFDTARDPAERVDLAARMPPAVLQAVAAELLAWRRSVAQAYAQARGEGPQ